MLELTKSQQVTPDLLHAELRTARRAVSNLTAPEDRQAVERYIMDLELELAALDWRQRRVAGGRGRI